MAATMLAATPVYAANITTFDPHYGGFKGINIEGDIQPAILISSKALCRIAVTRPVAM